MIAGPNGSGKTTLTDLLRREINRPFELILNPDAIEKQLRETKSLAFDAWHAAFDEQSFNDAVDHHPLRNRLPAVRFRVEQNVLILGSIQIEGYFAAVLSDVLRRTWIADRTSFAFETVMSSPDKVEIFRSSATAGYRTYLYFVCTDDSEINQNRVQVRVKQGAMMFLSRR